MSLEQMKFTFIHQCDIRCQSVVMSYFNYI